VIDAFSRPDHPVRPIRPLRRSETIAAMIFLLVLLVVVFAGIESPWNAILIIAAAIAEVGEVTLLRQWSKRLGRRYKPTEPDQELVGSVAEVVVPCRPRGQVRVRGELWAAVCAGGADEGAMVRVDRVDALTLVVTPVT
jgi:membrane protein implicated in regulation of membrane protease activity